jgi:thiosulfate reductase cytochrome b subunit
LRTQTVDRPRNRPRPYRLVYRQNVATRLTHWVWAISFVFLLMSGLQIFNARPVLYVGSQSGFQFDNAILTIEAEDTKNGPVGKTIVLGRAFDTDGVLGASRQHGQQTERGFPSWATLPNSTDLATGRIIHFFFAWVLVGTLLVWLLFSIFNGHLKSDVVPTTFDLRNLPRDLVEHLKLRFDSGGRYNPLQKITYAIVLLVIFPLLVATGLSMSPGIDAVAPWLLDIFGGRQTARTIHFLTMTLLVIFVFIHLVMVLAAGPINELRSMTTGWYRTRKAAAEANSTSSLGSEK